MRENYPVCHAKYERSSASIFLWFIWLLLFRTHTRCPVNITRYEFTLAKNEMASTSSLAYIFMEMNIKNKKWDADQKSVNFEHPCTSGYRLSQAACSVCSALANWREHHRDNTYCFCPWYVSSTHNKILDERCIFELVFRRYWTTSETRVCWKMHNTGVLYIVPLHLLLINKFVIL